MSNRFLHHKRFFDISRTTFQTNLTYDFSHKYETVISPKPMDQEPESHIVGVVIALLTSIILLLVAAIMFIVARNKRTPRPEVLNSLQHNFNQDTLRLGLDKRGNNHMKVSLTQQPSAHIFHVHTSVSVLIQVSMDDNESIDKSSLYHEPFNVNLNMYTSAASGCSLNDLQRQHVTPDYTGTECAKIYSHQT